ncbi:MAG: DUF2291 domain-containing protein [Anaerolineae bacterium]|nr:DUF2291 domain-containing protein [Anaerolineae bacterium]
MHYDRLIKKFLTVALLSITLLSLSGCVIATVRSLDEDEEAKAGFNSEDYVADIWESRVLPTYAEDALDITELLAQITANEEQAIADHGHRSGTGAYSFMVRGTGQILTFDTSSRAGLATIDLDPPDGTPDVTLTIGPLIKISQRASVRDAVGFIEYGNFVNQQEFADVANAMGDQIITMLAERFGAENADAIRELDPASIEGKTITFVGAFSLDNLADVLVVPVDIEVSD